MESTTLAIAAIVIQLAATATTVGMYIQTVRESQRRITRLEEGKVDKAVHDEVTERIDSNLHDVKATANELKSTVGQIQISVGRLLGRSGRT